MPGEESTRGVAAPHPLWVMAAPARLSIMAAMRLYSTMRRDLARNALAAAAQVITVDTLPTTRERSRKEHLRNGVGALLNASSVVAFRPGLFVTLFYVTRARVRADLVYGLDELRRAATPPPGKQRLLLLVIPGVAAAAVIAARARRGADEPETADVPEQPEPTPVAA